MENNNNQTKGSNLPRRMTKHSKNKKKNWKQIKHSDVELFLDETREDERLGGIRTKPDSHLFQIDNIGFTKEDFLPPFARDESLKKLKPMRSETGPLVNIGDLKCFTLLKPHSAVPDPIIKRNRIAKPGEGKSLQMHQKDNERLSKKVKVVEKSQEECKDPWSAVEPKTLLDSEWIPSAIKRQNLRPRAKRYEDKKYVKCQIPAVEAPHPGYSFNPSFNDHQDLLSKALEIESTKIRKMKNLIKATAPTKCLKEGVEKFEGILDEDVEVKEESDEDKKPLIISKSKPKTKQQKKKVREEREKSRASKLRKEENVRLNEVFRIKSIQKEIKADEKKQKERLAKIVSIKNERDKFGQKKLSKHKYVEPPLDPALSEEISGTLVGVPSHNNLLVERYKSLQKRNILEPRVKLTIKRKNPLKKYIRSNDKMDWEKTGYWKGIKVVNK